MPTGSNTDLTRLSATALRDQIAAQEVSPVEVLDAHLAVIARLNPTLNAVVTLAIDDEDRCPSCGPAPSWAARMSWYA